MKTKIPFLLILFLTAASLSATEEAEDRITAVTVFTDRAQVTREAVFGLTGGEQTLVFTGLPAQIDPDSIQVKGSGAFTLADVKLTSRFLTAEVSRRIRELTEDRRTTESELQLWNDRAAEAESEKRFIENITKKLTAPGEGTGETVLEPQKWMEMVSFYRDRLSGLNQELRETREAARKLREELERLDREIQSEGANRSREIREVQAVISARSPGPARLELSYMVYGPSWTPDYTLRVDGGTRQIELMYQARILQSTGEDWTDVRLQLSTARPQVSGRIPELTPWFISAWKPQTYRSRGMTAESVAAPAPMAMEKAESAPEMEDTLPEMEYRTAEVSRGTAAVQFVLPGTGSIPSDNQPHRVTVSLFSLKGTFRYAAVPRLSPFAYLEAEVTNTTEFPLLEGTSHIFLDGSYVADARLDTVSPEETFRISLGIDERVTVRRTLLNRFEETSGLFNRKKTVTWNYQMEITNSRNSREVLILRDQLPVSQSGDITVTLLQPAYREDTPELKKTDQDYLEWTRTLAPGETQKLPFSYKVEYPENLSVSGLE